jgi:hypothetical protein
MSTLNFQENIEVKANLVGPRICGPKKSKLFRLQAESGVYSFSVVGLLKCLIMRKMSVCVCL